MKISELNTALVSLLVNRDLQANHLDFINTFNRLEEQIQENANGAEITEEFISDWLYNADLEADGYNVQEMYIAFC